MRPRIYASLSLAVFLCATLPVVSRAAVQEFGKVTGTVVLVDKQKTSGKETRKPAQHVVVTATGNSQAPSTRTDEKGNFQFTLREGWWTITAEYRDKAGDYEMQDEYGVDVNIEKKDQYPIIPDPPIYLTREIAVAPGKEHRLVLVLYRAGDDDAPAQADEKSDHAPVLTGRVVDSAKRPVSGARVSVKCNKTNSEQLFTLVKTKTNKDGKYTLNLTGLPRYERYVLSVAKDGFGRFDRLFTWSRLPPALVTLREVSEGPLLEKTEATRRYVFSPRVMESLPVPGLRSFDSFALLAPGVQPPPDTPNTRGPGVSPGVGTAGQFAVNGLRSRENNFTVDGSDNNDEDIGTRRQGFVALAPQPVESLQEFQIVTALGGARFGRDTGGQVNALTKSGTPDFHGSLYGFITDSRLNARGAFDQTTQDGPPSFTLRRARDGSEVLLDGRPVVTPNPVGGKNPFTRSQVGFVAGGPLEAFSAFFFASLERVSTRAARESHFVVPTVEQRGLFGAGGTGLLLDGLTDKTGAPAPLPLFPTTIPGDAGFSLYPFPNNPLGPFGANTYTTVLRADGNGTRLSAKLDRQFGSTKTDKVRSPFSFFRDGDILIGRYSLSQETSTVPVTGDALFSSLRPSARAHNLAFYINRTLAPHVSDVIRASLGRTKLSFRAARDPYLSPSTFFPGDQFLLNAPLLLNVTAPLPDGTLTQARYVTASSPQGAALLNARGYSGVTSAEQIAGPLGQVVVPGFSPIGVDVFNFPQSRANNTIQVADTLTYVTHGGHILTFGTDVRKIQINSTLDRDFRPLAVFGGLRTSTPSPNISVRQPGSPALQTQAFSPATLLAGGTPTGLFQTLAVNPNSTARIRFVQISFFEQTNWRAGKNLNINLGSRLNYLTRLHTKGKTLERDFDLNRLQGQARTAAEECSRASGDSQECDSIVNAILSAFPGDFNAVFKGDKLDLDARTGLAWALNDRTVVRGGFGIYSGELPGIVLGQSRNAFPDFLPLNFASFPLFRRDQSVTRSFLFNPSNPLLRQFDPTLAISPNSLNTLAPNVNAISFLTNRLVNASPDRPFSQNILGLDLVLPQRALKTPYALQYGLTLEHQFGRDYTVSVSYVGTRGVKLLRVNTPDLGLGRSRLDEGLVTTKITSFNFDGFPDLAGFLFPPQESIPKSHVAIARTLFESSGLSNYNSLQVELRRRYARRFQFTSSLTYSHTIDDVSDFFDTAGAFALPQNSLLRSERASSDFDIRLRSVSYFIYDIPRDLPFSKSSKLGGWQVAGVVTAQTGQPFTVNSAFDINRDGNLTDRLNTADGLVGGGAGDGRTQLRIAPGTGAFALLAQDGHDGAVGRNTFRAPGLFNVDLAVTKYLNFSDRYRLQLRTEFFNLLNRADFGIPARILESPAFGKSTYTTVPPRTVQFAAKFFF